MPIRPMLAAQYELERVHQHLIADGILLVQPKIDGMRVLCDDGKARSRSWKLWTNTAIQSFAGHTADQSHGWDGEMLPGIIETTPTEEAFREAQSGLRAASGSTRLTYYLFDNFDTTWACIPYWARLRGCIKDLTGNDPPERWDISDLCDATQVGIDKLFEGGGYKCLVKICPTFVVSGIKQLQELEEQFLDQGFEGAIIRRRGRGYKWNRSTALEGNLIKMKRFTDFEAVIEGVYPRQRNDNEAQISGLGYTVRTAHKDNKTDLECLGGFYCHLLDNPDVKFNVGVLKGLDMGTKERLWQERDRLNGKVITCVEQGYKGGYDKPRTPVFHRFRDPIEL